MHIVLLVAFAVFVVYVLRAGRLQYSLPARLGWGLFGALLIVLPQAATVAALWALGQLDLQDSFAFPQSRFVLGVAVLMLLAGLGMAKLVLDVRLPKPAPRAG